MNQNAPVPFVIIESPYAGDIDTNETYARACLRDSILKGEAPFASHLLYTQKGVLRDEVHEERELGMGLGWHVARHSNYSVFYTDRGWSSGMVRGYEAAAYLGHRCILRRLGAPWSEAYEAGVDYARVTGRPRVTTKEADIPSNAHELTITGDLVQGRNFIEIDLKKGYAVAVKMVFSKLNLEVVKFDPNDRKALRIGPATNNA